MSFPTNYNKTAMELALEAKLIFEKESTKMPQTQEMRARILSTALKNMFTPLPSKDLKEKHG